MSFRDWASLRYHLLWAYEGPVWPAARDRTTIDPNTSCWLLRKGRLEIISNGLRQKARPGQWIFVAMPERHQIFSDDAEILSLHFHLTWPGGVPLFDQPQNVLFESSKYPELEKAARPLVRQLRRLFPGANAFLPKLPCPLDLYLRVQNLLPIWLAAYVSVQTKFGNYPKRLRISDDRILHAIKDLDHQPLSEKFSEIALAKSTGLGRSQLNALFTKAVGLSPAKYFERRRLDEAKALLSHTNSSVKEIAFSLGFRYESHFSMWFRRLQRVHPTAYRLGEEKQP